MQNRNRKSENLKIFKLEDQFGWSVYLPKKDILNLKVKCASFHFLLVFILQKVVLFSELCQVIILYRKN